MANPPFTDVVGAPQIAAHWANQLFGPRDYAKFRAAVNAALLNLPVTTTTLTTEAETFDLEGADGEKVRVSLYNLAKHCVGQSPESWPALLLEALQTLLASYHGMAQSWGEAQSKVYVRLTAAAHLDPETAAHVVSQPVSIDGELLAVVALDEEDVIRLLTYEELVAWGVSAPQVWKAAYAQLEKLPVELRQQQLPHNGPIIGVISGQSPYVAAQALILDKLVPTTIYGTVFAAPIGELLFYHLISNLQDLQTALVELYFKAQEVYREYQDAITPKLYWRSSQQILPIEVETQSDGQGLLIVLPDELLSLAAAETKKDRPLLN
jgi:hypothetical protein